MKRRLELAGIRSISLIVDITNYVLLEMGQPPHAFDCAKLESDQFTISATKVTSEITTLDDIKREIPENTLLINNKKPIAIAGVMGAKNTDVSDNTADIFLESAYFDAKHVRKTGTQLGLRTESAIRFEKGINTDTVDLSSLRACHLPQTLGDATILDQSAVCKAKTDQRFSTKQINFDSDQINQFLGSDFKTSEMLTVLETLGFS